MIYEILGWGVFSAGSFPVMDARWSDTFGRTPELSARLQAKIWTYATCFQVVSPIIGAQIFARNQVILPAASGVSNEGRSSPVLVPVPAVSWPWVPAWGSLEPPRRDGENAKPGNFREKNGRDTVSNV